jgi:hypothetical protein
MNRRACGLSRPLVAGLLLAGVLLMPDVARGQTATPAPTPSRWQTSGCADFYPKWIKREFPETPENEKRALACLNMSPFEALGCPALFQKLSQERSAGIPISAEDWAGIHSCVHLGGNPAYKPGPPQGRLSPGKVYTGKVPLPPSARHLITAPTPTPSGDPVPTPSSDPPPNLTSPSTSSSSTDPVPLFSEFAGGDMQATPTASPSPVPIGQPPDVNADASPTFNAEFLNGGLWIFNKDGSSGCAGTQTTTAPCITMANFWPTGSNLTDTQIAWDPVIQRWIATTLSGSYQTLLFAYSAGDDPNSGNWTKTSATVCPVTHSCPGCFGDEDILGYGTSWVAIDTKCFSNAPSETPDSILFANNSDITGGTLGPSSFFTAAGVSNLPMTGNNPVYSWRPSRDVSASAAPNLYLAASVANGTEQPYLWVATVCPTKAAGCAPKGTKTGAYIQPPISFDGGIGNASDQYTLPNVAISGCTPVGAPTCIINADDAEITQVVLQYDNFDGNNYLLTSFPTSYDSSTTGSEVFQYEIQLPSETFEEWYLSSPSAVFDFPTVAMDQTTDLLWTAQNMGSGNPATDYYYFQNFPSSLTSQGTLLRSRGTYTGPSSLPPTQPAQRWGDYMTSMWDPSVTTTATAGTTGVFWTAQEYTQGGTDESTEWFGLAPSYLASAGGYLTAYSYGEIGICAQAPADCTFTVPAPSGGQNGDVILLSLVEEQTPGGYSPTAPTGWTLFAANQPEQRYGNRFQRPSMWK